MDSLASMQGETSLEGFGGSGAGAFVGETKRTLRVRAGLLRTLSLGFVGEA